MNPNFDPSIGKNTQFSSENQPEKRGRRKNIYTVLRETGYSAHDIRLAFGEMAWHAEEEIKAIKNDPTKPIIARIVAKQFLEALKGGNYLKVKEIIEQVIGKANAKQEITYHPPKDMELKTRIVSQDDYEKIEKGQMNNDAWTIVVVEND